MIAGKIILIPEQNIWFTADTHYGHTNICRGTSNWDLSQHGGHDSVRDFDTLDEMNQTIVSGINSYVMPNDILIHNGDVAFGGFENIPIFMKRLTCKNVILVLGNHDHHIDRNRQGIQGFFNSVHGRLELNLSRQLKKSHEKIGTFELCHFPMAIWNKAHHNRIHLHGYTHGSYIAPGRALDIGIDRAYQLYGEYRPFSLKDIFKYMEDRGFDKLSHHNSKTN